MPVKASLYSADTANFFLQTRLKEPVFRVLQYGTPFENQYQQTPVPSKHDVLF